MQPANFHKTVERPPALPGTEIDRGWASSGVDGDRYFAHYAISRNRGAVSYRYRGKLYERSGSHLVLGEAGEFIASSVHSYVTFRHWWIEPDLMREAAEGRGQKSTLRFDQETIGDFNGSRHAIRAVDILDSAVEPLEMQEGLARVLDILLSGYVHQGRVAAEVIAHRAVRRMRDLINDGYDRELSLDVIAEHARLNKFYALRAFKKEMGVTPHGYQRHLRAARARELLRAGHKGADIAYALGYCDHSHFVRAFMQATLVTPHQYQLAVRA